MRGNNGFTLVELMIVIGLMALLAFAVAPLTGTWVQDANLLNVEGEITQAVGRAKAASLRNEHGAINDLPVAAICISNTNLLTVLERSDAANPNCAAVTGTQTWSTQLDTAVTVSVNNVSVTCMCLDNKGLPTTTSCNGCVSASSLVLTTGNNHSETVQIF